MPFIDDTNLTSSDTLQIIRRVGRREVRYALHDVDGTHSLIRQWPPIMSATLHYAMTCGLADNFDSAANAKRLIDRVGKEFTEETNRFCVESAGLSALTQMEFAVRRAVQLDTVPSVRLTPDQSRNNDTIIERIWAGHERFPDIAEPRELTDFLSQITPRLYQLYEVVLNGACRDRNTADAWNNPTRWRVPGSVEFLTHLKSLGVVNYFVTGAVIYPEGGMYEEVQAVRIDVGPGKLVEGLYGSTWDRKIPKEEVMRDLCQRLGADHLHLLIIGDGRSEIQAGVNMGAVVMSRLDADARRPRELHRQLGTNYMVHDYLDGKLEQLIRA